jgi:DNA polymerase III epsilon subunit-like protein
MRAGNSYAVIDFETTGFNARGHDRVVEIGVALLRSDLVCSDSRRVS